LAELEDQKMHSSLDDGFTVLEEGEGVSTLIPLATLLMNKIRGKR